MKQLKVKGNAHYIMPPAKGYLVDVYPVKVQLHDCSRRVDGVLDVPELSVSREDVDDGDDGLPF